MADFFRTQTLQSVNVIELAIPEMIDALEFDRLNETLLATLDGKASQSWLLDLSSVDYLGSATLGLIVNIRQQIKAGGGKLVLCGMSARLKEIFHTCSMERLFTIAKNRPEAIKSLGK
ncbi:MAG TPA: STAS domain-containing protein [Tepidisphaeraceae bacterium]|nr:STAS domain-containing protein [Tepidisphaeraceae bacterium]